MTLAYSLRTGALLGQATNIRPEEMLPLHSVRVPVEGLLVLLCKEGYAIVPSDSVRLEVVA